VTKYTVFVTDRSEICFIPNILDLGIERLTLIVSTVHTEKLLSKVVF